MSCGGLDRCHLQRSEFLTTGGRGTCLAGDGCQPAGQWRFYAGVLGLGVVAGDECGDVFGVGSSGGDHVPAVECGVGVGSVGVSGGAGRGEPGPVVSGVDLGSGRQWGDCVGDAGPVGFGRGERERVDLFYGGSELDAVAGGVGYDPRPQCLAVAGVPVGRQPVRLPRRPNQPAGVVQWRFYAGVCGLGVVAGDECGDVFGVGSSGGDHVPAVECGVGVGSVGVSGGAGRGEARASRIRGRSGFGPPVGRLCRGRWPCGVWAG